MGQQNETPKTGIGTPGMEEEDSNETMYGNKTSLYEPNT